CLFAGQIYGGYAQQASLLQKGVNNRLFAAAESGSLRDVQRALDAGASVNAQIGEGGYTALMWASSRGHAPVVELLLKAGADTTLKNFLGKTAPDIALREGKKDIV